MSPVRRLHRLHLIAIATVLVLLPAVAVDVAVDAAPALAATAVHPTNGRVVAATSHTFTVQVPATPGAARYVVSASTDRTQMTVAALRSDTHNRHHYRASSASPTITVDVQHFTRTPFYYRVAAIQTSNGYDAWADTYSPTVGLRPGVPAALKRHSGSDGAYLAWTSTTSNGAWIQQATTSTFTSGVRTYRIRGTTTRFTPYGLTRGQRYWFRVRAINVHTYSLPSAAVSLVAGAREQPLRVMSYNLLGANLDGRYEATDGSHPGRRE